MASKSTPRAYFSPLTIFMVVFGLIFLASSVSASSQASAAAPSPSVEVELICHTDNPAECYPKIFQPTEEFQIVHDDQELPHGLHVRMNINTGEKEAKINDPKETNPALEGMPVDRSIVVVDSEEPAEEPQLPEGAPKYDPKGAVKQPQQESSEFYSNLEYVKKGANGVDLPIDEALEFLEDISHDIYYGLKITETFDTIKALLCLMTDPKTPTSSKGAVPRDQQAAAIISGALQNNPTALEEVTKVWPQLMEASCSATEAKDVFKLGDSFYASFMPSQEDESPDGTTDQEVLRAVNKAKAQVSAIRGLLKSPSIRDHFIANKGMDRLLEVLAPEDARWDTTQRKTGQLVLDSFLDENMGADLGVWPLFKASEADTSKRIADRVNDGNWKAAVKTIMERNKGDKGHWSKDLYDRLDAHEQAQLKKLGKQEL
ncbi:nucleotide exchange factor sil1 [Colletotrichum truncatum]|uniref:Nucleotide exchange factor sil1 n=1 Tax=Colletotrichum truncatum TaxID=5467 RepID=A0ACC3YWY1_COLTU|nr:nucleotide exchange factor sil1 [Colletotrichum truncatum]KAF6792595.1 nucleotide exchange factor sil1 [Colletotrichum truncatum]